MRAGGSCAQFRIPWRRRAEGQGSGSTDARRDGRRPMALLTAWDNFYVIVGSSAGALIGLTFVVITLIDRTQEWRDMDGGLAAFTTPTVVHFGTVLLVAAMLSAPWRS